VSGRREMKQFGFREASERRCVLTHPISALHPLPYTGTPYRRLALDELRVRCWRLGAPQRQIESELVADAITAELVHPPLSSIFRVRIRSTSTVQECRQDRPRNVGERPVAFECRF